MISEAALLPQAMPLPDWKKVAIKIHALAYRLGKRWQGTAATQKINSIAMLAGLYFFVLQCGGGYLYIMCLIGFFFRACLHERSQKMRSEPIRPHYVNVASGSFFFGVGFCSVLWVQLFYFFY